MQPVYFVRLAESIVNLSHVAIVRQFPGGVRVILSDASKIDLPEGPDAEAVWAAFAGLVLSPSAAAYALAGSGAVSQSRPDRTQARSDHP